MDGTRERPSGEVTVVSSGDLEVDPTDWEKYSHLIGPRVVDGISAYSGGKKPTRGLLGSDHGPPDGRDDDGDPARRESPAWL